MEHKVKKMEEGMEKATKCSRPYGKMEEEL